ncbi:F-box/RNI-like/FBD-like domains-containing protein [Striga asiatica]|uniref:F-box/RNI-like/FBD-like domains-containing protein n=1 Tax=Striga asiatica TaxID=4170 RepID=A0A5A7R7K7_STRAF|nr:F-box/RNI-like/FBD-like domains-containing protein [Striga asiatica]
MEQRRRRVVHNGCGDQHRLIDRISILSDDILLSIMCHLTFREVVAASILSLRWRYLWTFSRTLDFDGLQSLVKLVFSVGKLSLNLDKARLNYVTWVDRAIVSHKESTIDELRVFFNLSRTYTSSIDKWLRFALAKKVQRLELNLTDNACFKSRTYNECYDFPYELLFCNSGADFKYLKRLSLNYVNVNGEALEFILRICPLLEDLSVAQSGELKILKITGPLPSLKRVGIYLCHKLQSFQIRDVNIVHLTYYGSSVRFFLENVPLLVDACIGGLITEHREVVLQLLSTYLPKLERLKLDILNVHCWAVRLQYLFFHPKLFYSNVKMSSLKQLVVNVGVTGGYSLLQLANLICMSPFLQSFVLKAYRGEPKFVKRKMEKVVSLYPHLKELKFEGYCGEVSDLEFIMHFMENAALLQNIVIDPRKPWSSTYQQAFRYNGAFRHEIIKEEEEARSRAAEQLTHKVPRNIYFEIL